MRRHIAKYNQSIPKRKSTRKSTKSKKRNESQRSRRNKRLRQTYFSTTYGKNKDDSFENAADKSRSIKRRKYRETTLDEFYPIMEKPDEEMQAEKESARRAKEAKNSLSDMAKNVIKNVLHSKLYHVKNN